MAKKRTYEEEEEEFDRRQDNNDLVTLFSGFDWKDAKRSVRYGGKKKAFDSPERLWYYACQYFEYCEQNPMKEHDFIKGGNLAGKVVIKTHPRPFTWKGFESFLWVRGVCSSLAMYKYNRDGNYGDYQEVLEAIGNIMFSQKFDYTAAGMMKEGLISYELYGDKKGKQGFGEGDGDDNRGSNNGNQFGAPIVNVYYDGAPPLANHESEVDLERKPITKDGKPLLGRGDNEEDA